MQESDWCLSHGVGSIGWRHQRAFSQKGVTIDPFGNKHGEPDWAEWRRAAIAYLHDVPRDLPRDPQSIPPLDPRTLVAALRAAGVRWLLDGSVVLLALGVELAPGDLDVVPDLDHGNLERLASLLYRLDAFPEPSSGWEYSLTLDEVSRWRPLPAVEGNLNHRFVTEHGILDVVPRLTGTYQQLLRRARLVQLDGEEVMAADPQAILVRLRASTRPKDRERWGAATQLLDE